MFAGIEAVEAINATGVVYGGAVASYLDGLCLTTTFAESAMDALAVGDARLQPRKTCQQSQCGAYGADGVAV